MRLKGSGGVTARMSILPGAAVASETFWCGRCWTGRAPNASRSPIVDLRSIYALVVTGVAAASKPLGVGWGDVESASRMLRSR
jgi:hypothetical protein